MSYEVLARRWRPQTFDDVAGQRHVTETLANALRSGKLPHALLFTGPRGVGKTSIARILARALNCDQGPTEAPCGECAPCREIASSTSMDVQEIDAASHTGIDNVREIRDSIRYAAAPGKHRIFIIDEVHMLSAAAFNGLLKTLEEPPPNSLFIFATTDPQKIPATVLSRVQRFDLKRLGAGELLELLREIVKSEKLEVADGVLRALVREGDGSARDALTLLDRLVSGVSGKIGEAEAAAVLDLVDRRVLWQLLEPILSGDAAAAISATRAALDLGVDASRLAGELLAELRHLLVARLVPDPADLIDLAPEEVAELSERARSLETESLQRMFRVLLTRIQDLAFAPRPAHALELAVVRLATLPDTRSLAELVARLEGLGPGESGPKGGSSGGGARGPEPSEPARGRSRGKQRARPEREAAPAAPQAATSPPADPDPAADPGPPPEPEPPRAASPEAMARLRNDAKTNPVVRDAIEILDAELRDVRGQVEP